MAKFKIAQAVQWKWLGRAILDEVVEIYTEPVERLIKDKKIKRNGSAQKPAYLVKSAAGNLALKLESELELPKKSKWKF